VVDELQKLANIIDEKVKANPTLKDLIAKTGQRPANVVGATAAVLIIAVLLGFGPNALTNLIGFAYPIYASFKALKTDGQDDDTHWLTYWVVFGFFTLAESLVSVFLKSFFYFVFKAGFLIWCFLPQTMGAQWVFTNVIEKILNKYETKIDGGLASARGAAEQVHEEVKDDVAAGIQTATKAGKKRAAAAAIDALVDDANKTK